MTQQFSYLLPIILGVVLGLLSSVVKNTPTWNKVSIAMIVGSIALVWYGVRMYANT